MGLFSSKNNQKQDTKNKTKEFVRNRQRIPNNVLDSIPYEWIYPSLGIIKDYDGRYSKSYDIKDTNFDAEEEEHQENMVLAYEKLLNLIDTGMVGQLTIVNRTIDPDVVRNSILMKPAADGLNDLRAEWNDLYLDKLATGKNNIHKDKIFTVSVPADNIKDASDILRRMDHNVNRCVRKINRQETNPMTIEERLSLLYDIYNPHSGMSFAKKMTGMMDANGKINFNTLLRYGITSKELIAPDSMDFYSQKFALGDNTICKSFFLDHLPTQLSTSILNDLSDLPCNMICSVSFIQMNQDKAIQLIKNQALGMNKQIAEAEHDAAKAGVVSASVISQDLEHARDEAQELMSDVMKRNQKIFRTTVLITIIANDEDDLKRQVDMLRSVVSGSLCQLRAMNNQEELAFNTTLPLAQMNVALDRILTTEAASVFIPFSVQDLNQIDGIWYGTNPLSGNMIRYNRKNGSNYNGLILGASGSGKSFMVKEEIAQRFLTTDDQIIIIDPEGEYTKLGQALGATIINISLDGKTHINPLDMDIQFGGEGENPIPMKCDEIESLIESMVGGQDSLSAVEKAIIQRVGRKIYIGYYNYMQEKASQGITIDRKAMPTLQDFFDTLTKQPEPQAQYIATAIESYCVGNYSVFAERTNVKADNRMIVYNVKDMASGMKELAMHVCLSDAWNRVISNGMHGKFTALYIDEFHLFTKTRTSASFMKNIYKRARKWKGIPTAITQNIGDMFVNDEAEAIINNCSFVIMMNQTPVDRATLADMYHISQQLLEHITDQPFGNGLIYNGSTIVPFENDFPADTKMFALMDSRQKNEEKVPEEEE